jgi:hypothetical protein
MGSSCCVEDCSTQSFLVPPAVVLDSPLATRILDEHINIAQPPLALQRQLRDGRLDQSVSSVNSSVCGQYHEGSVNGSARSSSAANQQLVMDDTVGMWHPTSASIRQDHCSPTFIRTAEAMRAIGVVSQCSLRSSSRHKSHRRGCGGASPSSAWSEDSSNTWAQFTAHDTQQHVPASGEAMWALAKFRLDCPLVR